MDLWERDWGKEYEVCPRWQKEFSATQTPQEVWLEGIKLFHDKMYKEELLCVPLPLQEKLIRDHHSFLGHVGFQRLWDHMSLRYEWAELGLAKKCAKLDMGMCEACQACRRPTILKTLVESTPVPARIMTSVALDIFHTPTVLEGA